MAESSRERATKTCPFCAEDIQRAAIVCKHCGRDLDPAASTSVVVTQSALAPSRRTLLAMLGLLVIGLSAVGVYRWSMTSELLNAGRPSDAIRSQKDRTIQAFLQHRLEDMLSDPDSARYEGLQLFHTGEIFTICGKLNAKNGFGGYVGYRRFVASTFVNPDGTFDEQATSAHIDKGPSRVSFDKDGNGKNWFSEVYASACKTDVAAVNAGTLQEARRGAAFRRSKAERFDAEESLFGGRTTFQDR